MTPMEPALAAALEGLERKIDGAAEDARSARDEARAAHEASRAAHEEARAARNLAGAALEEARAARAEARAAFDTMMAEMRERDRIVASLALEVRGLAQTTTTYMAALTERMDALTARVVALTDRIDEFGSRFEHMLRQHVLQWNQLLELFRDHEVRIGALERAPATSRDPEG